MERVTYAFVLVGFQSEVEELETLAKELLPEGHPMQGHLQRALRMLQVTPPPMAPSIPAVVHFHSHTVPALQDVHATPACCSLCIVGCAPPCDAFGV